MNGEAFSVSEALRYGWETFKRNVGPATLLALATLVATFLVDGLAQQATARAGALAFGSTLLSKLMHALLSFLWVRFALAVHDGRPIGTRELLPSGLMFVNFLAVSIMYGLLVMAGLVLLVVPGLYLAVRYGFVGFVVADGRPDPMGAFRESSQLTRGVRGRLFLLAVVLFLMNIAGALVFGIGLLLTLPMTVFATAYVYRRLAERAASLPPIPSTEVPPWPPEFQQR
ncbi:MAG: hypothetical protein JWP87_280 [Labilithrix sp.]|nr:hypothetical protein [Labilithrix sp.]